MLTGIGQGREGEKKKGGRKREGEGSTWPDIAVRKLDSIIAEHLHDSYVVTP